MYNTELKKIGVELYSQIDRRGLTEIYRRKLKKIGAELVCQMGRKKLWLDWDRK